MKFILLNILMIHVGLLYGQSSLGEYNHFTPERRQVLSKMGFFFDETIRKNFPAETDTLSYSYFQKCVAQSNGSIILDVDRPQLKEINQMLFKDHNYYFFYARYIYMGKDPLPGYEDPTDVDSVPTVRGFGSRNAKYGLTPIVNPILNHNGYIKVVPDHNPAIKRMKKDMEYAGDLSITIFLSNVMDFNVREVSQPVVKELCAVVFWRYLCVCGGVDLLERRPFCESCNL